MENLDRVWQRYYIGLFAIEKTTSGKEEKQKVQSFSIMTSVMTFHGFNIRASHMAFIIHKHINYVVYLVTI